MENRKLYFLDLLTLLTYLRGRSCTLTSEFTLAKQAATGHVVLKNGQIVSCLIYTQDGSRFEGEQAYQRLLTCTQWRVQLE